MGVGVPGHLPTLASARRSHCGTMLGRGSSFARPNRYNVQGCDPPRLLELFGSSEVWFFCFLFLPGLHTRSVWGDWANRGQGSSDETTC
jgi:hypothetical protein